VASKGRRQLVRLGPKFRVQDQQKAVTALTTAGFQARSASLTSA
jgi:hypothetical protein